MYQDIVSMLTQLLLYMASMTFMYVANRVRSYARHNNECDWVANQTSITQPTTGAVVLCVCLSVYDYSRTTGYEAA